MHQHSAASLATGADDLLQGIHVDELDLALLDLDKTRFREAREQPADCFEFQAKIAADFLTAHAQHELGRRVAAARHPLRKIQQKRRQTLFSAHGAQHDEHIVIVRNFLAHETHHLRLQGREFPRQRLQFVEAHDAHFTVFERNGIRYMKHFAEAIKADDFTWKVEARNLAATIRECQHGFQRSKADAIHRREWFALAVQQASPGHTNALRDQRVHSRHVFAGDADRQTDLSKRAGRAACTVVGDRRSDEHLRICQKFLNASIVACSIFARAAS